MRAGPRRVGAVFACAAAMAACVRATDEVVIGVVYGSPVRALAQEAIDSLRGPRQRPIRLLGDEPVGDRAMLRAVNIAQRFVAMPNLAGVVGHPGSGDALLTAPIYNEARVPHIVPTATSSELRRAGPWTFLLAPDDSAEGAFIASFAASRLGARTASILYTPDPYGVGLARRTAESLAGGGVRVLHQAPLPRTGCSARAGRHDLDNDVRTALARGRPDVMVAAARTDETVCLVEALRHLSAGVPVIAGDGTVFDDQYFALMGTDSSGVYAVGFWYPGTVASAAAFERRYVRLFGHPATPGDALAFDALMVLARAIREVGPNHERIRGWLNSLGKDRPAYQGVTGPITFPMTGANRLVMLRPGARSSVVRVDH